MADESSTAVIPLVSITSVINIPACGGLNIVIVEISFG